MLHALGVVLAQVLGARREAHHPGLGLLEDADAGERAQDAVQAIGLDSRGRGELRDGKGPGPELVRHAGAGGAVESLRQPVSDGHLEHLGAEGVHAASLLGAR